MQDTTPLELATISMGLGRGARPVWRRALAIYDRTYRGWHGLDRPGAQVGPALCVEVRPSRRALTLPDSTRLERGARVGELHLANARLDGLHARGLSTLGVGLEFRRRMLASLAELARRCEPGGPLDEVGAFCAVTVFHRGLARLGFAPERDGLVWPGLVAVYQRALLASLHPDGGLGSRRSNYGRACRLWITREALCARYGRGAIRRREALDR